MHRVGIYELVYAMTAIKKEAMTSILYIFGLTKKTVKGRMQGARSITSTWSQSDMSKGSQLWASGLQGPISSHHSRSSLKSLIEAAHMAAIHTQWKTALPYR